MSAAPKLAAMPANTQRLEASDILTPEQLAERLQVPKSWVYKKAAQPGSIPVIRCGRYLRFSWPDVCAWLRSKDRALQT